MQPQHTTQLFGEMPYTDNLKSQLKSAAVWGGIAAILSLAGNIISLISDFIGEKRPAVYREGFDGAPAQTEAGGGGEIIWSIIIFIVAAFFFYFLNRFSTLTKNGLNASHPDTVSDGLGSLASYFIMMGVLVILGLIVILILFAGMAAGLGS